MMTYILSDHRGIPITAYRPGTGRLRALIEALGGGEIVGDVDKEAAHLLYHLYQDLHSARRTA